jgi:hypothetical protein
LLVGNFFVFIFPKNPSKNDIDALHNVEAFMMEKFIFKDTAFKHTIFKLDILNAFEQRLFDHALPEDEEKYLLIGPDRNGNLLEIMYNVFDDDTINVFHAMKCRKTYEKLLNL